MSADSIMSPPQYFNSLTRHRIMKSVAGVGRRFQQNFVKGHTNLNGSNVIDKTERFEATGSKPIGKFRTIAWESKSGSYLVAGSADSTTCVFETVSDRGLSFSHSYKANSESVDCVRWSPSSLTTFATASQDRMIRLFDVRTKDKYTLTSSSRDDPLCLSWHPSGNVLAVSARNNTFNAFDVRYGIRPLVEHEFRYDINEFAWDNRERLYVTTAHGTLNVFDWKKLRSGVSGSDDDDENGEEEDDEGRKTISPRELKDALIHELPVSVGTCICVDFQPDDYARFAVGCVNASVYVFDTEDRVCVSNISSLEWSIRCLSFSPDKQLIVSASEDDIFDISSVETGEHVAHVQVPSTQIKCAKFKPAQPNTNEYIVGFVCEGGEFENGCVRLFRSNENAKRSESRIRANDSPKKRTSPTPQRTVVPSKRRSTTNSNTRSSTHRV